MLVSASEIISALLESDLAERPRPACLVLRTPRRSRLLTSGICALRHTPGGPDIHPPRYGLRHPPSLDGGRALISSAFATLVRGTGGADTDEMRHCNQPSVETVVVVVSSAILAATVAAVGTVGADIDWLVPLGAIVSSGHLPSSIPSAAAPTSGWHDALAGAQLVVWWVYRHFGGERGLVALQMLAAGVGLGALALGLRRQARALGEVIVVCALVVLG